MKKITRRSFLSICGAAAAAAALTACGGAASSTAASSAAASSTRRSMSIASVRCRADRPKNSFSNAVPNGWTLVQGSPSSLSRVSRANSLVYSLRV